MPDQYTEIKTISYSGRIKNAFKGFFGGLVLIPFSIFILYTNEGGIDYSKIVEKATYVPPDATLIHTYSNPVYTTGPVYSDALLSDEYLKPRNLIVLKRKVEMYAWKENRQTDSTTNVGGTETQETTYKYLKEWTETPQDSSRFKYIEGHTNPTPFILPRTVIAATSSIGRYVFKLNGMKLPETVGLGIADEDFVLPNGATTSYGYMYVNYMANGTGTLDNPVVGDIRIRYEGLPPGFIGTAIGTLEGKEFMPFQGKEGDPLYRLFRGTKDEMVVALHSEYEIEKWVFRAVGFVIMFIGFNLLAGIVVIAFDFFPVLGSFSGGIAAILSLFLTFLFSSLTIGVSMIFHNLTALLLTLGVMSILVGLFLWRKKRNQQTHNVTPSGSPVPPSVSPTVPVS